MKRDATIDSSGFGNTSNSLVFTFKEDRGIGIYDRNCLMTSPLPLPLRAILPSLELRVPVVRSLSSASVMDPNLPGLMMLLGLWRGSVVLLVTMLSSRLVMEPCLEPCSELD